MDNNRRRLAEGWLDKASNDLYVAKEHVKIYTQYSDAVERAQEAIELYVKAIFLLLDIPLPASHALDTTSGSGHWWTIPSEASSPAYSAEACCGA